MNFNFLDWMLILLIGWSVISGFVAGFARVGVGLAGAVLGIIFGFWFYATPAAWVRDYFSPRAANLIGFLIVYIVVQIIAGVVGRFLAKALKWAGLSWMDRLLGGAFGLIRGALVAVALVMVITAFAPAPPPKIIAESRVMPYVSGAANVLAMLAPTELRHDFRDSLDRLRRFWHERGPQKNETMKSEPV